MPVSLKDKVVLVLGACSGIGRETAILFAREGARVVASARRGDRLRALQEQLVKEGHSIDIALADASASREMEQLAERTLANLGKIDVLVYVTGTNVPDRSMKRLNHKLWDMLLSVNLNGAYYITSAVLPRMREAGSGHLIYISSISGLVPDVSGAAYQASKRGLLGLSHASRVAEKDSGIRTCATCPRRVCARVLG